MNKFFILIALWLSTFSLSAQSVHIPAQNKDAIANFSLNEDDTTRYANHYLYERAYKTIESKNNSTIEFIRKHAI